MRIKLNNRKIELKCIIVYNLVNIIINLKKVKIKKMTDRESLIRNYLQRKKDVAE